MKREDLSKNLVGSVLEVAKRIISKEYKGNAVGSVQGRLIYEIGEQLFDMDQMYRSIATYYKRIGCGTVLEEFEGDGEKNLKPAIEGLFVVCDHNTVFMHIENLSGKVEINVWLRE